MVDLKPVHANFSFRVSEWHTNELADDVNRRPFEDNVILEAELAEYSRQTSFPRQLRRMAKESKEERP